MKQRIPVWTAALLLCLTLITTSLTCGMYARYTTGGTASERARVAKFGQLSLTMTEIENEKLLPGVTSTVVLDPLVSMTESEVAVVVYVDVTLPKNSGWSYKPGRKSFSCGPVLWTVAEDWTYLEEQNKTYTFYHILAPGESLSDQQVVEGGGMTVPQNYDDYYSMSDTEVNLEIRFKARAAQID